MNSIISNIDTGIPGAIIFILLIIAAGWLIFPNEGWSVFLILGVISAILYLILSVVFSLLGEDLTSYKIIVYILVAIPWAGMVVYQSYFLINKIHRKFN